MTDYLHVESPENIITTERPLYFFERRLTGTRQDLVDFIMPCKARQPITKEPPIPGQYVIFPRKHCYYTLRAANDKHGHTERFVLPGDLLRPLQTKLGDAWRNSSVSLLNTHNALRTHPNEQLYWQELLRQILTHPSKYPTFTDKDKLLFALTWHGAHLFWDDPRNHGTSAAFARGFRHEQTEPVPKAAVYPDPGIAYTSLHYRKLWRKTLKEARSGSACAPYTPDLPLPTP